LRVDGAHLELEIKRHRLIGEHAAKKQID